MINLEVYNIVKEGGEKTVGRDIHRDGNGSSSVTHNPS